MNEEEIIKTVDRFVDDERLIDKKGNYYKPYKFGQAQRFVYKEQYDAIQGLLDLYNQEKEKNKKLEEVIDLMAEDIWKTDDYFTCKDIKMKEDCYADTLADGNACGGNCIKQYYFKKAGDRS